MTLYVDHWVNALEYFGEVIESLAYNIDNKSESDIVKIIKEYSETVDQNHEQIFSKAASELKFYMNFYDVRATNGKPDELKIYYFLGTAIAECFGKLGLSSLEIYQLKAVQRVFNKLLDCSGVYRAELSMRMDTAIEKGALSKDFGRFGWYVVHRCLLNSTRNRPTQTGSP